MQLISKVFQARASGHAILQEYVRKVRPQPASKCAFVRMESFAGERFEVDWAHFDVLNYSGARTGGLRLS